MLTGTHRPKCTCGSFWAHTSTKATTLCLRFIVLQCHNYCIHLTNSWLIYDPRLYISSLLMHYLSPGSLTVSVAGLLFASLSSFMPQYPVCQSLLSWSQDFLWFLRKYLFLFILILHALESVLLKFSSITVYCQDIHKIAV